MGLKKTGDLRVLGPWKLFCFTPILHPVPPSMRESCVDFSVTLRCCRCRSKYEIGLCYIYLPLRGQLLSSPDFSSLRTNPRQQAWSAFELLLMCLLKQRTFRNMAKTFMPQPMHILFSEICLRKHCRLSMTKLLVICTEKRAACIFQDAGTKCRDSGVDLKRGKVT